MRLIYPISFLLILCVLWQILIALFSLPPYILPAPSNVIIALWEQQAVIFQNMLPTLWEATVGFLLATFLGVIFAIGLHFVTFFKKAFLPFLITSQALPAFALAPLFVIWFGYGFSSKIVTCVLVLFFPITSAFYDGLERTPRGYLELAKIMHASRWATLYHIQIPFALPHLATGLRLAAVFSPMAAMIGEWVGSSQGLGFLLLSANAHMKLDLFFATLIIVAGLTYAFYWLMDRLLKHWIDWQ